MTPNHPTPHDPAPQAEAGATLSPRGKGKSKTKSRVSAPVALQSYAELHCISNFTFLRGASFPEELVERAEQLGYSAIAITDECSLSGVVKAHMAAKERSIKLIIGSEFVLQEMASVSTGDEPPAMNSHGLNNGMRVVLLAFSRTGYGELSHLISCARRRANKGKYRIDSELLKKEFPEDCALLWVPDLTQADAVIEAQASYLQTLSTDNLWIAAELLLNGYDRQKLRLLQELGQRLGVPVCAAGGVYMHEAERRILQDTLTAIRLVKPLTEVGFSGEPNSQRHLRPIEQLKKLYPARLLEETLTIAKRCNFSLDELRYEYPSELVPKEHTAHSWLWVLTREGMKRRWPQGVSEKNMTIIEHEMRLIKQLSYEHFFLTVHEIVCFAVDNNIYCQGRGSAANSAVCYCLGITEVSPDHAELLFERFLSPERSEPPDIDVDFENSRREEVIQHIYQKYGRHRTAIAATVITYRSRSAVRDVGKALGLDDELINRLAKSIFWWGSDLEEQLADSGVDYSEPKIRTLITLCQSLMGFPRHLSQHVGGFVISQGNLSHLVPIENAAMADRTIIQWDKDDLESLGLLKVDVLALGMLSAIHKAIDLVNSYNSEEVAMDNISLREDPEVYDMICEADTVGVFQIESRAQMSMLPRLKPRNYYDLVIQIAIVRPGPIQGDMVHPYLERRKNPQKIKYESEAVKQTLERTLGVPIFQEQIMKLAMVAAGFSPGEADQLRRAMAAWKKKGGLEPFRDRLVTGMGERGYSEDFALRIYSQIKGFGDYGFPESHSASFALLAYVSSWLKCHHPAAFCCALLNCQPMGFYLPAQLIQDAERHGVVVLPVDVNESSYDSSLESKKAAPALRLGFSLVKGLSVAGAESICLARSSGRFTSVQDLLTRTALNKKDSESLAAADALNTLSGDRHRAFWTVAGADKPLSFLSSKNGNAAGEQALAIEESDFGVDVLLPVPSEANNIMADYASTGLTLRRHPVALLRPHLDRYGVRSASSLPSIPNERVIKVTGIVTSRQRPQTAAGVTFLTLEDETGFLNVVVWPSLGERRRPIVRRAVLIGVVGHVQKSDGVIHLIARELVDLSHWLGAMNLSSRDFA
ncbi:MAG: error-prone DNA polymerase [Pseudohongiella sp.]|nr:MAG: error-prone DNA polymerase [Pseudohongiella sp.]